MPKQNFETIHEILLLIPIDGDLTSAQCFFLLPSAVSSKAVVDDRFLGRKKASIGSCSSQLATLNYLFIITTIRRRISISNGGTIPIAVTDIVIGPFQNFSANTNDANASSASPTAEPEG